jgi:hypothetical protein
MNILRRDFLLRLEQLHKSENQTLTKTDQRLESSTESLYQSKCSQCFILAPGNHSDGKASNELLSNEIR